MRSTTHELDGFEDPAHDGEHACHVFAGYDGTATGKASGILAGTQWP